VRLPGEELWGLAARDATTLSEVVALRAVATALGQRWPIASNQRTDYAASINAHLAEAARPAALQQLDAIWPIYQLEVRDGGPDADLGLTGLSGLLERLLFNKNPEQVTAAAVLGVGLIIIVTFYLILAKVDLKDLAIIDNARGLLTFLFGLTTVGISIIVVLSVFLSRGSKDELGERFQRGKDILTVLIGVFGAILGYYFGTDKGTAPPREPAPQTQQSPRGVVEAPIPPKPAAQTPSPPASTGQTPSPPAFTGQTPSPPAPAGQSSPPTSTGQTPSPPAPTGQPSPPASNGQTASPPAPTGQTPSPPAQTEQTPTPPAPAGQTASPSASTRRHRPY
jgi:hypothetical protein